MPGLTRQLTEFIVSLTFDQVPREATETAKRGAIDCIGVLLAGRDEPVVEIVSALVRPGAAGEARVLFDRGFATAADAALANGTAAHALDYDDTALDGHPSVVLVPATLAVAERVGASGKEWIASYLAGYETWAEVVARDADKLHSKGWHPTAVVGTVAAAAAAARLARLDASRTASALGIAASMAAGLTANFGSMTKPFQAGRAAQSGILAARLAERGMTAAPDALEHPNGFLRAISPAGRVRADAPIAAGRDWHILRRGLNIKRYPLCYGAHRAIDGILDLRARHAIAPDDVAEIIVSIGREQDRMLRYSRPCTALEAKFSAEFAVAAALIAGRVGLIELVPEFVNRLDVQSLISKVRRTTVDEVDAEDPLFASADTVAIRLKDGTVLTGKPVRHALGHAHNPIGIDALHAKFADCVGGALAPRARDTLFERLRALETLPAVTAIYS